MADIPFGQRAVPMLAYEDVGLAVERLGAMFGFVEHGERFADPDGTVTHAEVELGGALIVLGDPGRAYQNPDRHARDCAAARHWLEAPNVVDGALIYVDDVAACIMRARENGATILRDLEAQPFGRLFVAADHEGHRWMFLQPPATAS
ncbi:MAG: hypothetical protein EPO26_09730 [Chloroflexota bacterium]|nr:MAG: hypothetical protein EPO26_09730 [Chloroflexota bacterium]